MTTFAMNAIFLLRQLYCDERCSDVIP